MSGTKQVKIILRLSVLVLATACSTGGGTRKNAPDWVNGVSSRYSNSLYLIGRGESATLDDAKDRARADLTKSIEVVVSEQTRDVQSFTRESKDGKVQEASQLDVTRAVQTRTDKVVRGIEIGDVWNDEKAHRFYALAVLNRHQVGSALRQTIDQLDAETQALVGKSSQESALLRKLALAKAALEAQLTREGLQRTLQVIDTTGQGIEPKYNIGRMRADTRELAGRIRMETKATGNLVDKLAPLVKGAVGEAGFVVDATPAEYVLTADLQLDEPGLREGWYWTKGSLNITVADAAGHAVGAKRWEIKASAQTQDMAQRRALDQLHGIMTRQLRETVIGFAGP
ncbi:MAG: LPP20 family lipoprotein [Pseudomonadota bacterium]|mgnify:CR=1 FL=1